MSAPEKKKTTKNKQPQGAEYINKQRRDYSLYILQHRAVPYMADGLKASTRRVMWTARDGKKWKSANLAGACMPIHPHASPEDAVNTLAAHYGNNAHLLTGLGSFGTRLDPTAYGASRYTSVHASDFAKAAFYTDIDLIPMKPNYDNTLMEPVHFLPLVPLGIINPVSGIAVGFACDIFPRGLADVINCQIKYLQGIEVRNEPMVHFQPLGVKAQYKEDDRWIFKGEITRVNTTTVQITNFPASVSHEKLTEKLIKLIDDGKMVDFDDDSRDTINITCKFRRDQLLNLKDDDKLLDFFGILKANKENINLINFDGTTVVKKTALEVIKDFTMWRLDWFITRYERLAISEQEKIQRYMDILTAIKNDAGGQASKIKDRESFKKWLESIGIINIDYIATLPVYRFTKEEKKSTENKIKESKVILKEYNELITCPEKRSAQYINELKDISKRYG